AELGKKVLTVDMDPQGNTSSGLGLDKDNLDMTVYQLMIGECELEECRYASVVEGVDVLPATVHLAGAEVELIGIPKSQYILKNGLAGVKDEYDYILIDCPPSLNLLTINAMTAADAVLVPIQCEYYALEGLSQLLYTIGLVQKSLNPKLEIEGVVFTMYDARTNLSMQVVENVKENLRQNIYKTIIPRNVRLAEAPSHGLPINLYDSRSAGAEAYRQLAKEVVKHRPE
ncbi:MAG: ParA family protein, partial [Lachnospiraceae bacterium]|nr:ParA family protein [Lachnospiraceae bacterium]